MICKNCQHQFEGKFCNNCGQNANVERIDSKYLFTEIWNNIFQVDRGFFFTVKELFLRPGHSIREFLEGKRTPYFKPVTFVFVFSTLYVLISYFVGQKPYLGEMIAGFSKGITGGTTEELVSMKLFKWLSNNHAYSTLILLPVFSFASYLTFIKSKYNYYEHLVLNFYITGQQMIFYMLLNIIMFVIGKEVPSIFISIFFVAIMYTFWTYFQFFEDKHPLVKILLTLLTYFLYTVIMVLIASLAPLELEMRN